MGERLGLHSGHAYTVNKVTELKDGTRLIRVRNPHGNDNEWQGDWSDGYHDQ